MKPPEQTSIESVNKHMIHNQVAYSDIEQGTRHLLVLNTLFWTERVLLKLTNWLAQQRLAQLAKVLSNEE